MVKDCPNVIVSNLDQEPFCELVVHSALQDKERLPNWCVLLGEAVLRSLLVALKLSEIPPSPSLGLLVSRIPRKRRWHGMGLDSLYGQVITVALNESDGKSVEMALTILRSVPPCGRSLRASTVVMQLIMFTTFYFLAFVLALPLAFGSSHNWSRLFSSVLSMSWALYWVFVRRGKGRFYRAALNLGLKLHQRPKGLLSRGCPVDGFQKPSELFSISWRVCGV
jgi:hypothetical protein